MAGAAQRNFIRSVLVLGLLAAPAAADPPTRTEIARRGKAATAFLLARGPQPRGAADVTRQATAFCIHPSGLFVTSAQAVQGAHTIELVLNSSLKDQKVLKAAVIRTADADDLALLRADTDAATPALPLGDDRNLDELATIVAVGFPFGDGLTFEKAEYPSVTVSAGTIAALRMKSGALELIQLTAALNPGHAGGPILDANGQVIGVALGGVRGTQVNFATPVRRLAALAAKPGLQLTLPAVTAANRSTPAEFRLRAVAPVPPPAPLEAELVLTAGGKERTFKMERAGETFRTRAAPVPAPDGPPAVRLTISYPDGSVTGWAADQPVRLAGQELTLSAVARLQRQPRPTATLHDGRTLTGDLAGLSAVPVRFGDEKVTLDLTRATAVRLERPATVSSVECVAIVRQGGQEVARLNEVLTIGEPAEPAAAAAPTPLEAMVVTRELPARVADVAVGGGGRFLILHLPQQNRLAVFDGRAARVVRMVPVDTDVKIAAGMGHFVVVKPAADGGTVERWSLTTFEREATADLGMKVPAVAMAMGAASDGPLVISGVDWPRLGETAVFDVQAMKRLDVLPEPHATFNTSPKMFLRASADGRMFVCQASRGRQPQALVLANGAAQVRAGDPGTYPVPGPDGQAVYTATGVLSAEMKRLPGPDAYCWPALHGPYYLSLDRPRPESRLADATLHVAGHPQALGRLSDLDGLANLDWKPDDPLTLDRRVLLVPDLMLLIVIPRTNDRLILHRFNPEAKLRAARGDYLVVTSSPPLTARRGQAYAYRAAAVSSKGGVRFRLVSGPGGMTVSPEGVVAWRVPADHAPDEVAVSLAVRDAGGEERSQNFVLRVSGTK